MCSVCYCRAEKDNIFHRRVVRIRRRNLAASASSGRCIACAILASLVELSDHTNENLGVVKWSENVISWRHKDGRIPAFEFDIKEMNDDIARAMGFVNGRTFPGNTSSTGSLTRARAWIDQCIAQHERCSLEHRDDHLPTHVIDIAPNDDFGELGSVKLIDQAQTLPPVPYVALTYCWGTKVPNCLMTRESLK
jgi:hypothetical protein